MARVQKPIWHVVVKTDGSVGKESYSLEEQQQAQEDQCRPGQEDAT